MKINPLAILFSAGLFLCGGARARACFDNFGDDPFEMEGDEETYTLPDEPAPSPSWDPNQDFPVAAESGGEDPASPVSPVEDPVSDPSPPVVVDDPVDVPPSPPPPPPDAPVPQPDPVVAAPPPQPDPLPPPDPPAPPEADPPPQPAPPEPSRPALRIVRVRFHSTGHDARLSAPQAAAGQMQIWTDPGGLQSKPWPEFQNPREAPVLKD